MWPSRTVALLVLALLARAGPSALADSGGDISSGAAAGNAVGAKETIAIAGSAKVTVASLSTVAVIDLR